MIATTLILLTTVGAIGALMIRDIHTRQYAVRLADQKEQYRREWGMDPEVIKAAQRWRERNQ